MKAVRVHKYGGADQLIYEDDVIVPQCEPDKLLIKVHAAGVNPVDTYIRQGIYSRLPAQLPYIPGFDGAGFIEEIGADIEHHEFKVGDRVYFSTFTSGSYAEFCCVPKERCWHLPDHLSFEQGAAIGIPYFTAYRALFQKCNAHQGQTALVHGASGAVGLAACQLAHAHQLTVFGTAGSDEGLKLIKNNGCFKVFNHRSRGYMNQCMASTMDNKGFDIIVEMLANVNLNHDLAMLRQNGIIAVVGSRGQVKIDPTSLMAVEGKMFGVALFQSTQKEWHEITTKISSGLKNRTLVPVVGKIYTLKEAVQAHREIIETKATTGKLVIKIDDE